jgi:hypothetical protein
MVAMETLYAAYGLRLASSFALPGMHAGDPVLDPGDGSFGRLVEL